MHDERSEFWEPLPDDVAEWMGSADLVLTREEARVEVPQPRGWLDLVRAPLRH